MLQIQKSIKSNLSSLYLSLVAWLLIFTMVLGVSKTSRGPVATVNTVNPVYAMASNEASHTMTRSDNENETVHMQSKFDTGLRAAGITGHL